MQPVESAQDVGRRVRIVTVPGRPVRGLGNPDVAGPLQHTLDADPGLGTRERSTRAGMQATAKCQVGTGVLPVDPELGRLLETSRIAVGRTVENHDAGARRDIDAPDGRRPTCESEITLDRTFVPQAFLDEI